MLYILISVFGTTDLMLLLPEHMFKMPVINFDLNLIAFYLLAPVMLFMLHFNILFNYNMYLKKIDLQHKKINMNTLDPSMYGYAYNMISRGLDGFLINLFLWIWIYIIPLMILILIYIRFADYHDNAITTFHLAMVLLDICLIFFSFYYNKIHLKHQQKFVRYLSYVFYAIFSGLFILSVVYHSFIFNPVINNKLDPRIKLGTDEEKCDYNISRIYNFIVDKNMSRTISSSCFPRLVVNEAEMAKISQAALYLPRSLIEDNIRDKNTSKPKNEKQLILEYGARSDLTHRNLRYANLYGCILTRTDLTGSDLQSSDLRQSHLQAAKLIDAKLMGAKLLGAKLDKTDFKDSNLTGANLSSAVSREGQFPSSTLIGSKMVAINFEKADFSGTNMTDADLGNANLSHSIFYEANLTSANLINANLTSANFINANLSYSIFSKANLTSAKFKKANLSNSSFHEANLTSANFKKANLSYSDFSNSNLPYSDFSNSDLSYSDFSNSNFLHANLSHSNFYRTNFTSTTFNNCILTHGDLSKTILISSSLRKCDLTGTTFYGTHFNNSILNEANLTATSLRNSNLTDTNFTDATLISVDFSGTYTDSNKTNVSLKSVLKSAKEVGGIIIQDMGSIKYKKPDRVYFTDENLTACEQYLTIKLENSDIDLKVTKRKIKYLIKGIKKYNNHEGEPSKKCPEVNSTKLSQTLQNALNAQCSLLEDFLKINPKYMKTYKKTINDCQKDYSKKYIKDLK